MFFTVIILWLLTNQTARNKSVLALRVCVLLCFVRFTYFDLGLWSKLLV